MAKGLQVCLVEEKPCASPVRDDVIHIRRFLQLSLLKAFLAIGMLEDEALPKRLPTSAVAALCRRSSHLTSACVTRRRRFCFDFGVALGADLRMGVAIAVATRNGPVTA